MTEPRARTNPQSARFHAICRAVSQQATFGGRRLSEQQWKVLFCSAHAIATNGETELIVGLENEYVELRESTAKMSSARMASLIEYCHCWAANNRIALAA